MFPIAWVYTFNRDVGLLWLDFLDRIVVVKEFKLIMVNGEISHKITSNLKDFQIRNFAKISSKFLF